MEKKLNLGCRTDILPKSEGWVSVDIDQSLKNIDVFHDLENYPYPFEENSISEIRIWNVLEHITKPYKTMIEMHRICKNGALIHIKLPHFSQAGMWSEDHKHGCGLDFIRTSIVFTKKDFKITSQKLNYRQVRDGMGLVGIIQNAILSPLINLNVKIFERYFLYWIGGVEENEYWVEVVKEDEK